MLGLGLEPTDRRQSSGKSGRLWQFLDQQTVVKEYDFPVDWLVRFGWGKASVVSLEVVVTDWGGS